MSAAVGCCGALVALSFTQEEQLWQQFITQGVLFGISSSVRVQLALLLFDNISTDDGLSNGYYCWWK